MLAIGFIDGVLYPLLYPLFVFDTPVSDRPARGQIHGPAPHQEMSGCGLRPTEGVREVELAWSFDQHFCPMQSISVTSPTMPRGVGVIASRLLASGYFSAAQYCELSPLEQRRSGIDLADLRFLLRNPIFVDGNPQPLIRDLMANREGDLAFSLAFDLVP